MKFSESWLKEFITYTITSEQLVQKLTDAGLEVDSLTRLDEGIKNLVVAEVITATQHPNADRLKCCQVSIGEANLVQVVCGGTNVRSGIKVILAKVGATLPENFKIKKSKIRGEESNGMICSAAELGLEEDSGGSIMELPSNAPVGKDGIAYLQLNDCVIDVDLTPNRGDCLSLIGIARELSAILDQTFEPQYQQSPEPHHNEVAEITVQASTACPRYLGQIIHNVDNKVTTPLWLRERLRRSSVRPNSAIVDIANYDMLELGQPLHSFDYDALAGDITVRYAKENEKINLINGQETYCNNDTVVIADTDGPIALAGVMGSAESAVQANTTSILLESAFFTPESIAGKARQYNLSSDACFRFERGVDPTLPAKAIARATQLIIDICGGRFGPIAEQTDRAQLPKVDTIQLRTAKIEKILGQSFDSAWIGEKLTKLGMQVTPTAQGWSVNPPTHRFDIERDVDLIEELARLYGYDKLPIRQPKLVLTSIVNTNRQTLNQIQQTLINRGYNEIISYSFQPTNRLELFSKTSAQLSLLNPISEEFATMRSHMAVGLLRTLQYNLNRQHSNLRLFETGLCFNIDTQSSDLKQELMLGGIATGDFQTQQWNHPARPYDFFACKADVEAVLQTLGLKQRYEFSQSQLQYLHPGQQATISIAGELVGEFGAVHPTVLQEFQINQPNFIFSLQIGHLQPRPRPEFAILSRYPSIRRDLALILDKSITAEAIISAMQDIAGSLLKQVMVFDRYDGKGIESGKMSLACSLILQHDQRTLVDQEVNELIDKVVARIRQQYGATLRQ